MSVDEAMARILVVEDDDLNRKLVTVVLRRAGHTVLPSRDAREADRLLSQGPVDAIVLDLDLPDRTGIEYSEDLRSRSTPERIPIIAITADPIEFTERASRRAGCDDFLVKPVTDEELVRRVGVLLKRAPPATGGASWSPVAAVSTGTGPGKSRPDPPH